MTPPSMTATTDWLKAPFCTKGLDPLGVQAPCIHIYGQLMPGITNVTNRARYFSFYPWLLWKYDQLGRERTYTEVSKWLRRADILFTMIGVRHRRSFVNDDPVKHDAALIGVDTLVPIVADLGGHDTVRLSVHATTEKGPSRYFMNPLGGLGQYYLGNLAELGIMGRNGKIPGYTPLLGTAIAEAFDAGVDGRRFVEVLDGDVVTTEHLDELAEFCPCQLPLARDEHTALLDLFFDPSGSHGESGKQRRLSLGLLLELVKAISEDPEHANRRIDHHLFRAYTYSGATATGHAWQLQAGIEANRSRWAVYQRNEMLSLATQSVFWCALRTLSDERPSLSTVEAFADWFASTQAVRAAATEINSNTVGAAIEQQRRAIAPMCDWAQGKHELALAADLLRVIPARSNEAPAKILTLSARLLLALVARDREMANPYGPMAFPTDYLSLYPVNLLSLELRNEDTWQAMTVERWLAWLASAWGIEAHLHVALRKLRNQSQDTFHVVPSDRGLEVAYLPDPTYTSPRFDTSMQVLQDLDVISRESKDGPTRLTRRGEELLDACHG